MSKKVRTFVISFIFTAVIVYFLLSNISLESLIDTFSRFSFWLLLVIFTIHISAYFFRNLVFYLFLKDKTEAGYWYLLRAHFIHNFYVHTIPASLGEFSFPLLIKKKVRPEVSIPVLFISRILFLLMSLLMFLIAVILNFDIFGDISFNLNKYLLALLLIVPAGAIIIYRRKILSLVNKFPYFKKIKIKITEMIGNLKGELSRLKDPFFSASIVIYTLLNILALTFTYKFMLEGMDIHLNVFQIIFTSSIGIAFVLIPIKSIGGFGTTEGAWAIGMMLLGYDKNIAIESGFAVHMIALCNVFIIFLIGWIITRLFPVARP